MIDDLKSHDLIYLATPYSKYEWGIEFAWKDASALAAKLFKCGLNIYSPIAHTHSIAVYGGIDPLDHETWMRFDAAMMKKSGSDRSGLPVTTVTLGDIAPGRMTSVRSVPMKIAMM